MKTNKIKIRTSQYLCTLIVALITIQTNFANNHIASAEKGIFDLWNYKEIIDIKLTFDFEQVFENRRSVKSYPAEINFKDETGSEQSWQIGLSIRGKYRRIKCSEMPPLKINFRKGDLRNAGLADFNDFKMVTHCLDNHKQAKELLLKEYLTYRLFNNLTEISYRVQLINITYEDVNTGKQKQQLGFLIEDTAQLRARIGAEKIEAKLVVDQNKYQQEYNRLVAVFQYLIGNMDWGFSTSKNVKYVKINNKVLAVPYDFDFAALVNAPYRRLPNIYPLKSRYDRLYLGMERSQSELEKTIRLVEEQKETLYKTVEE